MDEGLCTNCPNEVSPGYLKCAECLYRNSDQTRKYRLKNRREYNENEQARKKQRVDSGQCPRCGNMKDEDIDEGYLKCQNCREGVGNSWT
jgi:hypothetical protein